VSVVITELEGVDAFVGTVAGAVDGVGTVDREDRSFFGFSKMGAS
jgi:hypothetical protein